MCLCVFALEGAEQTKSQLEKLSVFLEARFSHKIITKKEYVM